MIILGTNSIKATGFDVDNSLRFNNGTADRLQRTQDTADSRKKFTLSYWMKKTKSVRIFLFHSFNGGEYIYHDYENDRLSMYSQTGGTLNFNVTPTRLFRDPSAWYHIVIAVDTTQGTASNRIKIYVNGVQETVFTNSTYPSQNLDCEIGTTSHLLNFGTYNVSSDTFDGYLAEAVLIDNQALAPDQFGEFDEDNGIWKPIKVSGLTFGTNGSYLEFKESGTGTNASGMGADTSGNTNHFAVANLTAVDQSTDTCTNNFCTINPLDFFPSTPDLQDGNLTYNKSSTGDTHNSFGTCTIGSTSGKWYFELKVGDGNAFMTGMVAMPHKAPDSAGAYVDDDGLYGISNNGAKTVAGSDTSSAVNSVTTNDIVGMAFDLDNGKFYMSKNGTWQNSGDPTSGATGTGSLGNISLGEFFVPMIGNRNYGATSLHYFNFGSPPYAISSGNTDGNGYGNFEYAVPSGYYSLNTKNLAEYG